MIAAVVAMVVLVVMTRIATAAMNVATIAATKIEAMNVDTAAEMIDATRNAVTVVIMIVAMSVVAMSVETVMRATAANAMVAAKIATDMVLVEELAVATSVNATTALPIATLPDPESLPPAELQATASPPLGLSIVRHMEVRDPLSNMLKCTLILPGPERS